MRLSIGWWVFCFTMDQEKTITFFNTDKAYIPVKTIEHLSVKRGDRISLIKRIDGLYFSVLPIVSNIKGLILSRSNGNKLYENSGLQFQNSHQLRGKYELTESHYENGIDWYKLEKLND
ncbi:MAG: hypothetical protein V4608_11075 [Bacteroidota bacterium]